MKKFNTLAQITPAFHWKILEKSEEEEKARKIEENPKVEKGWERLEKGFVTGQKNGKRFVGGD